MDKITLAGDVGGGVDKFIATQELSNPVSTGSKAHVAIDSLSNKAKPAVDKLADAAHATTHKAITAAAEVVAYVASNPAKAVAFGVVAGILLARLLDDEHDGQ
jgi:ElaB/YqjD/DUF883 family membrane-anchored ribosome-binding protein